MMQRSAKNPFLLNEPIIFFGPWSLGKVRISMISCTSSIDRIRKIRFLFSLETATNNIQGYLELGSTTQSASGMWGDGSIVKHKLILHESYWVTGYETSGYGSKPFTIAT